MPAPLTYANVFDYLLGLGLRCSLIGRSELTYTGEASASATYPLLLVEGDAPGQEITSPDGRPVGMDSFTVAVQVLDQPERADPLLIPGLLATTNEWVDILTEQLRQERGGQLVSVNKLPLPGQAGSALATGWRVELTLKLPKNLNRQTNAALFAPESE